MRRLCIHTITNKPWSVEECIARRLIVSVAVLVISGCALERPPRCKATYLTYTRGSSGGLLVKHGPSPSEVEECKIVAEKGDHHAAHELASYYTWYLRDYPAGDYWTIKAAELGNATCQWNAYVLLTGRGDVKYQAEAMYWLKKAAAQWNKNAIEKLKELNAKEGLHP